MLKFSVHFKRERERQKERERERERGEERRGRLIIKGCVYVCVHIMCVICTMPQPRGRVNYLSYSRLLETGTIPEQKYPKIFYAKEAI